MNSKYIFIVDVLVLIIIIVLSLTNIILIYIYNSLFKITSLSFKYNDNNSYQVLLKKLDNLSNITDDALNILLYLIFIYNLLYMFFKIIFNTKTVINIVNFSDIAVSNVRVYSNVLFELLLFILTKLISILICGYLLILNITEYSVLINKEEFYNINK